MFLDGGSFNVKEVLIKLKLRYAYSTNEDLPETGSGERREDLNLDVNRDGRDEGRKSKQINNENGENK